MMANGLQTKAPNKFAQPINLDLKVSTGGFRFVDTTSF